MAGFGSCLGSLLGMNNQTYGVIAGNGISYSMSTTGGLCLNNIQYYTVPTTYNTATTSSITSWRVMASGKSGIKGSGRVLGICKQPAPANKRKKALGISWGMVTLALTGRILGLFVR